MSRKIAAVKCSLCDKEFSAKKNLYAHTRTIHKVEVLDQKDTKRFQCEHCNTKLSSKFSLSKHKHRYHSDTLDHDYYVPASRKTRMICPCDNCDAEFHLHSRLRDHVHIQHHILIEVEELNFSSIPDFENWKSAIEKETISSYTMDTAVKVLANGDKKKYFNCHRSFKVISKGNNKRTPKSMGTNKINKSCTSRMEVTFTGDSEKSNVFVKFFKTHCGHFAQIGRIALDKDTRAEIAGKLAEGVTFDHILDSIRDSADSIDNKRLTLLDRKDMHNIVRDYKIDYATKRHESDAISVKLWVEEMEDLGEECPVLYFKGQDEEAPELNNEDFVLVIMTSFQATQLRKFAHEKICIDGTHGTNPYDIQLYTLMTVDEYGSGCPIAYLFSNRQDEKIFELFFNKLKSKVGTIKAKIFMSDDAPAFYNAWCNTMGEVPHRLLCTWHIDRNWRQNLNKINGGSEKKAMVYKTLRTLLQVVSEEEFHEMHEKVINNLLADNSTKAYGLYFQKYYSSRPECWAYCYRTGLGINTNMYLEAFHKVLKHIYLDGKKVKRLDKTINAVMKLTRDSYFKRLIKMTKNKSSDKQSKINQSHKASEQIQKNKIKVLKELSEWTVQSSANAILEYHVEKVQETCPGPCRKCVACNICIHTFRCSCTDHIIKLNICKHIHACVRLFNISFVKCLHVLEDEAKVQETTELMKINNSPSLRKVTDIEEIKKKIQHILHISTDVNISNEDAKQVVKKLDGIIEIFSKSVDMKPKQKVNVQANVAKQPRLENQKKGIRNHNQKNSLYSTKQKPIKQNTLHKPSINEENTIKIGLQCGESIHIHRTFDHSYPSKFQE